MSRFLFSVVAALCAFGVASAATLRGHHTQPRRGGSSPYDILEQVEKTVAAIKDKIESTDKVAQENIIAAWDSISSNTELASNTWKELLDRSAEKAQADGVNVDECVDSGNQEISVVASALHSDANECLSEPVRDLLHDLANLDELTPKAEALLWDAKERIEKCREQLWFLSDICLLTIIPGVNLQAAALVTKSVILAGRANVKASAIGWQANGCFTLAAARRNDDVEDILTDANMCIDEKISQTTTVTENPTTGPTETPAPKPEPTETPAPKPEPTETPAPTGPTETPAPTEPTGTTAAESTETPAPKPEPTETPAPTPEPTTGTPAPKPEPTETPAPKPEPTETPAPKPEPTETPAPEA